MMFSVVERRLVEAGRINAIFRRWERARVIPGRSYRTNAGRLIVDGVQVVSPAGISDAEAQVVGRESADQLRAEFRGEPEWPVFRIEFHLDESADARAELAASSPDTTDLADIATRLARLDRASSHGVWTADTLRAIADRPAVRAPDLAASFGRETAPFKLDVRKLKNLGLTYSLPVGYRLSPRGEAYLRYLQSR